MERLDSDPLKELDAQERKHLSNLMKTLKFTKKSDLSAYAEHEEVRMLFGFLESSPTQELKDFARYLRLLQEHRDVRQMELFVEYYAAN